MIALLVTICSCLSSVAGMAVGALWMRRRMTLTPHHKHAWGQWEGTYSSASLVRWQHRECLGCGELQVRKATPL